MNRRDFIRIGMAGTGLGATTKGEAMSASASFQNKNAFNVLEASVADLQAAMQSGKATSVSLVKTYLARIKAITRRTHPGPATTSDGEILKFGRLKIHEQERIERLPGKGRSVGAPLIGERRRTVHLDQQADVAALHHGLAGGRVGDDGRHGDGERGE